MASGAFGESTLSRTTSRPLNVVLAPCIFPRPRASVAVTKTTGRPNAEATRSASRPASVIWSGRAWVTVNSLAPRDLALTSACTAAAISMRSASDGFHTGAATLLAGSSVTASLRCRPSSSNRPSPRSATDQSRSGRLRCCARKAVLALPRVENPAAPRPAHRSATAGSEPPSVSAGDASARRVAASPAA